MEKSTSQSGLHLHENYLKFHIEKLNTEIDNLQTRLKYCEERRDKYLKKLQVVNSKK